MTTHQTVSPVTEATRHYTASAVVIDLETAKVLLIDHQASGRQQLPGGHLDPDAAGHDAAIREIWEETGVRATLWTRPQALTIPGGTWLPAPFMVVEFPAPPKPAKGEPAHSHIDLLYLTTADSTAAVTTQPAEVSGAVWLPIHELTAPAVREDVPVVVPIAWKHMTGAGQLGGVAEAFAGGPRR
jgi:8-oxo-dGTP pyrophosphatase MutT (NUDIX family)